MNANLPIEFGRLAKRRVYFTFPGSQEVYEKTGNCSARLCDVLRPRTRITVRPKVMVNHYKLQEVAA